MTRVRGRIGLLAAAAICVIALSTPRTHTPAAVAANTGPQTLATAWPHAVPFTMPGVVQGEAYQPLAIIADGVSIGTIITGDNSAISLIEVTGANGIRFLQGPRDPSTVSYDAFAATSDALYWMRNLTDAAGIGHETLWTADRGTGVARVLTSDVGEALFQGSVDDLRISGGVLAWVAADPQHSADTEIRSIPLAGGGVTVQDVPGNLVLGPAPWLVSGPAAGGTPVLLDNVTTGASTTVRVPSEATAACSPAWCVLTRTSAAGASQIELTRLDGTGATPLGGSETGLVGTDATQMDRFIALSEAILGQQGPHVVEQVWLYDIANRREVEIAPGATAAYARGAYLWWSAGDNETLTWYGLDLAALR